MTSKKNKNNDQIWDVIVIGGGPAGLMAAGQAGKRGLKVLLLEKNQQPGRKLALTGGGRCNIFNAEPDRQKLLDNYKDRKKFLFSPFAQHGPEETRAFFEGLGLAITIEARQRAFPASQQAEDVVGVLKKYLQDQGVVSKTGVTVEKIVRSNGKLSKIESDLGPFTARAYVLATGGTSHPETGSTGEGLKWLKELGHTVEPSNPNLVPLQVRESWVKELSGLDLSFIKITFGSDRKKDQGKFSKTGKILFTHFGLSGPMILNASQQVKQLLQTGEVPTQIDLYPDTDLKTVKQRVLKLFQENPNKLLKNTLPLWLPPGLTPALLSHTTEDLTEKKIHEVSKAERECLAELAKALPLTVISTMGLDRAITSDGGVDLAEVDTKTMRSKLYPELYLIGDVLNIDRPSGGFSLQLCWTTGWVAGNALPLKDE